MCVPVSKIAKTIYNIVIGDTVNCNKLIEREYMQFISGYFRRCCVRTGGCIFINYRICIVFKTFSNIKGALLIIKHMYPCAYVQWTT